jgi:hypothetical protein
LDRAQEIGLFRWQVISEATDFSWSARERGALVRALAARGASGSGRAVVTGVAQHGGSVDPVVPARRV